MWTTPAGARPSGSSMTIAKLFVPSGAPDQASGGETFSPTQFGLRCLSAQAFLTASRSLSFKAEEVSVSTSARAAPNDRAKTPANNKLPSAPSAFHCWVEFTELDAGVRGGELPIGFGSGGIAPVPPSVDMALERCPIAPPVRQVAAGGAKFDLGHIQPRAVLGRVVDLEPVGEALGLCGGER